MRFLVLKKNRIFLTAVLILSVFVSLTAHNRVILKAIYPLNYKEEVFFNAKKYNIDCLLIFSIIKVESGFNENALSNKGAVGLMQITQNTGEFIAKSIGKTQYNLKKADINIEFGTFYLKYLTDKFESSDTAIVAYNAGEGNVSSWLKNEKYSSDKKTLNIIPFKESEEYLKKVRKTFEIYVKLYGNTLDKELKFE